MRDEINTRSTRISQKKSDLPGKLLILDDGAVSEETVDQITLGEKIDKGELFERSLTRGHFGETIDKRNFKRDNQSTKGALLERLNITSMILLTALLLLVHHCSRPSHILYALCLFLLCLIDEGYFPREYCFVSYNQNASID